MTKRSSTHESIVLALELLSRIPKSRQVTAAELQSQLSDIGIHRDIRSIQRNLEMLCEHFDVEKNDTSKPYGYKWKPYSRGLSLPNLSPQESLLLGLAEQYLANLLPKNLMSSMASYFSEAQYQLKHIEKNQKEKNWLKKVRVVSESQPLVPPKVDSDVFKIISEALYFDRKLSIHYRNFKREQRNATVLPLGLAQQGQRMYLVCRFEGYDNERSVAVHRIDQARMLTEHFVRPSGFDLRQYDDDGRFGFGEGERCLLSFCVAKSAGHYLVEETKLSELQQVEEFEEHYQITAPVIRSKLLENWLRGFDEHIWNITMIPISDVTSTTEPSSQETKGARQQEMSA